MPARDLEGGNGSGDQHSLRGGRWGDRQGDVHRQSDAASVRRIIDGRPWQSLGVLSFSSITCNVQITDQANGNVIADAVRLVPVRNLVSVTGLQRSLTSGAVIASATVTVLTPP